MGLSNQLLSVHCKMEFFFFQNNSKKIDPSNKMDLDLWDCLGRVKLLV